VLGIAGGIDEAIAVGIINDENAVEGVRMHLRRQQLLHPTAIERALAQLRVEPVGEVVEDEVDHPHAADHILLKSAGEILPRAGGVGNRVVPLVPERVATTSRKPTSTKLLKPISVARDSVPRAARGRAAAVADGSSMTPVVLNADDPHDRGLERLSSLAPRVVMVTTNALTMSET